ncbi:MAG TPA: class I SAM-dependent methyltransferase [Polyangiaceae bacterium]|nr:class I SAM-dependent methyltransferase [Polyangiaceae bacterium]
MTTIGADVSRQRSYWDRHAHNYDASMRLLGGPLPRVLELTAEAVRGADTVLEVAAGTGIFTNIIARGARHVVATDYSAPMVEELRKRVAASGSSNVECRQADIYALELEPASLDVVVAANVLHLLPDLPRAFEAIRRVLKPGGVFVAPTFCHDETLGSKVVSRLLAVTGFPGQRRFSAEGLVGTLERAGFEARRSVLVPGIIPVLYVDAIKELHSQA